MVNVMSQVSETGVSAFSRRIFEDHTQQHHLDFHRGNIWPSHQEMLQRSNALFLHTGLSSCHNFCLPVKCFQFAQCTQEQVPSSSIVEGYYTTLIGFCKLKSCYYKVQHVFIDIWVEGQKKLVDELPQVQFKAANPYFIPFPHLSQHGGGVLPVLCLPKNALHRFKFSKPQNICCKSP